MLHHECSHILMWTSRFFCVYVHIYLGSSTVPQRIWAMEKEVKYSEPIVFVCERESLHREYFQYHYDHPNDKTKTMNGKQAKVQEKIRIKSSYAFNG